jgi:hypothetical protein
MDCSGQVEELLAEKYGKGLSSSAVLRKFCQFRVETLKLNASHVRRELPANGNGVLIA